MDRKKGDTSAQTALDEAHQRVRQWEASIGANLHTQAIIQRMVRPSAQDEEARKARRMELWMKEKNWA